jgi:hypothetical protein
MGRPNYSFKKRQKELARKKKKEEKRQRKMAKINPETTETPEESGNDVEQNGHIEQEKKGGEDASEIFDNPQ